MARVYLSKEESNEWRQDYDFRCKIADTVHALAGDLGGWGIDLMDENGNDLSIENENDGEHVFQYGRPKS